MDIMSYYRHQVEEARYHRDGWYAGEAPGKAPSISALATMETLLMDHLDPRFRFDITHCPDGSICLKTDFIDLKNPEAERSIMCTIQDDGSLNIQLVGWRLYDPNYVHKYLPHELREGAKFINGVH